MDQSQQVVMARQMPASLEAEQAVIGAMLLDQDAVNTAAEQLLAEDFYYPAYAVMYTTIVDLYNESRVVDAVAVTEKLKTAGLAVEYTEPRFIAELMNSVPTSANIGQYCNIVKEKAMLRRVIKTNQDIENACYEGTVPVDEILDRTEADFLKLLQNRGVSDFVPVDVVVTNALKKIEDASRKHGTVTGISTGFIDLDTQTAGLQPSDLILLAARPSMGKTAFALNLAHHIAVHENQCVAIFSLEMSKEQLINRMFALQGHLDAQKLRTGQLEDAEWRELVDAAGVLSRSNLIIDDTPAISVSEMRSKCRKYKQEYGLSLIMIDYLQLMESSGSANVSQQQKIADISRSLKALARELNVPVIALSQLNRGVEQRDDKRPMMSDLRDSGAIEQDADVVMFIYRDEYYNKDSDRKGIAEIIIAKQRNGPVGTVELVWLPQYTRFANKVKGHRHRDHDE